MKGKRICMIAALLLACAAAGCGSARSAYSSGAADGGETRQMRAERDMVSMELDAAPGEALENGNIMDVTVEEVKSAARSRKLIRDVSMEVETQDYDGLLAQVTGSVEALGGYIESSGMDHYGGGPRSGYLTIRVPQQELDGLLGRIGEAANVLSRSEQVKDVTLEYVDLESHKKALLTEQERLLELMGQAETVEDIIAVEGRLSEVRYQLESMETQLRMIDNQVDYSTLRLSVTEVERLSLTESGRESVWETIGRGFSENVYRVGVLLKELGIGLVVNLPFIIIIIAAVTLALLPVRAAVRKGAHKGSGLKRREKENKNGAEEACRDKDTKNGK